MGRFILPNSLYGVESQFIEHWILRIEETNRVAKNSNQTESLTDSNLTS